MTGRKYARERTVIIGGASAGRIERRTAASTSAFSTLFRGMPC